jgi:hypothetical protein
MEKLCQLIAEWLLPGAFWVVTSSLLPDVARLAWPAMTWAPAGLACRFVAPKAADKASASVAGRKPACEGAAAGETIPMDATRVMLRK